MVKKGKTRKNAKELKKTLFTKPWVFEMKILKAQIRESQLVTLPCPVERYDSVLPKICRNALQKGDDICALDCTKNKKLREYTYERETKWGVLSTADIAKRCTTGNAKSGELFLCMGLRDVQRKN